MDYRTQALLKEVTDQLVAPIEVTTGVTGLNTTITDVDIIPGGQTDPLEITGDVTATQGTDPWVVSGGVTATQGTDPWTVQGGVTATQGTSPWVVSGAFNATQGTSPWVVSGGVTATQGTSPWVVSGAVNTNEQYVNFEDAMDNLAVGQVDVSLNEDNITGAIPVQNDEGTRLLVENSRLIARSSFHDSGDRDNDFWDYYVSGGGVTFTQNANTKSLDITNTTDTLYSYNMTSRRHYNCTGKNNVLLVTFMSNLGDGEAIFENFLVGMFLNNGGWGFKFSTRGDGENQIVFGADTSTVSLSQGSWNIDNTVRNSRTAPWTVYFDFDGERIIIGEVWEGEYYPWHQSELNDSFAGGKYITTSYLDILINGIGGNSFTSWTSKIYSVRLFQNYDIPCCSAETRHRRQQVMLNSSTDLAQNIGSLSSSSIDFTEFDIVYVDQVRFAIREPNIHELDQWADGTALANGYRLFYREYADHPKVYLTPAIVDNGGHADFMEEFSIYHGTGGTPVEDVLTCKMSFEGGLYINSGQAGTFGLEVVGASNMSVAETFYVTVYYRGESY